MFHPFSASAGSPKLSIEVPKPLREGLGAMHWAGALALIGLLAFVPPAHAVPSFARQTGWSCSVCHTIFPQLTPIGRLFKLEGYTTSNLADMQKLKQKIRRMAPLELNRVTPLSVMIQASAAWIQGGHANQFGSGGTTGQGAVEFPEQVSFFYAGRVTRNIGTFFHVTYTHTGAFGMDDSDIRWAEHETEPNGSTLIYGAEINNTPTEPDLWNSVPDWNWPFATSNYSPLRDIPATYIQQAAGASEPIAGLGGYLAYLFGAGESHWLYLEADVYRSAVGIGSGTDQFFGAATLGPTRNVAPYLRIAYEQNDEEWNWEVGALGMDAKIYPTTAAIGSTDRFLDYGLDGQIQYLDLTGNQTFTAHVSWIHETEDWQADPAVGFKPNPVDTLDTASINGQYLLNRRYGAGLGYFWAWGTPDPALYGAATGNPAALVSANGSPDTNGLTFELNYLEAQNAELTLQYSAFNKYLGASSNYNGHGQNASTNNMLALLMWFAF
ncbi:MAG: cytochrome C [Gammaproteobacteria bacterium]